VGFGRGKTDPKAYHAADPPPRLAALRRGRVGGYQAGSDAEQSRAKRKPSLRSRGISSAVALIVRVRSARGLS